MEVVGSDACVGLVLTDQNQLIVDVNSGFTTITGYTKHEILGKRCNFLQGPETPESAVQAIRKSLKEDKVCRVTILNYRKDGTTFWNLLTITPIFGLNNKVIKYVGFQLSAPKNFVDRSLGYFQWSTLDDGTPRVLEARRSRAAVSRSTRSSSSPGGGAFKSFKSFKSLKPGQEGQEEGDLGDLEDEIDNSPPNPRGSKNTVSFVAETLLPTLRGKYRIRVYRDWVKSERECEIMCIIHGNVEGKRDVVVRVHDQCFTSEVLGSLKCDCREQLEYAMEYIRDDKNFPELCPKHRSASASGSAPATPAEGAGPSCEAHQQWQSCEHEEDGKYAAGMIIYMPQEGRGIGLANKIKAYSMQELGLDTVDANRALGFADDLREYGAVPLILSELGIPSIRLLTNNPRKVDELRRLGVTITDRIPVHIDANPFSSAYLHAKHNRMGHMLRQEQHTQGTYPVSGTRTRPGIGLGVGLGVGLVGAAEAVKVPRGATMVQA